MVEQVITEFDDGILRVTINRPEKKNALTQSMYAALADATVRCVDDRGVRVMHITGSGDAFTAGNDIADFVGGPQRSGDDASIRFLNSLPDIPVPVVAAVNGLAAGVGVTMLAHFDVVYASEQASFRTPFVDLGLVPEAASSMTLPALVGYQNAVRMLLLGDRLSASEAQAFGLVGEVFAPAELLDKSLETARRLAQKPANALRATKQLMRRAAQSAVERMEIENQQFAIALQSPEAMEAMAAFMEKRKPDFRQFD